MAGRLIRAVDRQVEAVARGLAGILLGRGARRAWLARAAAPVLILAGLVLVTAFGRHLRAMHIPGAPTMGLDQLPGPAHLDRVVAVWREWFIANKDADFRSPHALAGIWLAIDTFLLVPGYTLGALLVLLREHERTPARRPALLPTLRWSAVLALVLAAADLVENALTWVLIDGYWTETRASAGAADQLLGGVATLKWAAGAGVAIPVLIVGAVAVRSATPATRGGFRVLRAHVLVAALGIAAFLAPVQLPDLIVRWDGTQVAWTLAFLTIAAATLWATGAFALELHERGYGARGRVWRSRTWSVVALGLGVALVCIAGFNRIGGSDPWAPLVPLGAAVALFLAGAPLRAGGAAPRIVLSEDDDTSDAVWTAPRTLAAGLILVTGLAALQAWTALYVQRDDPWLVLAVGIGLLAGSFAVLVVLRRVDRHRDGRGYARVSIAATAASAAAAGILVVAPTTAPIAIGSVGIALAFVAGATVVLSGLVVVASGWTATRGIPPALDVVGFRRGIPVLAFLLVWGIAAETIDDARHWDVRTLGTGGAAGTTVSAAFDEWVQTAAARRSTTTGRTAIPMVLVATSGGGIRSAYWTALALDCLFLEAAPAEAPGDAAACRADEGPDDAEPADLFLASGISGGSLGLVGWDARLQAGGSDDWVEERLGGDFLSPSLARGLLVEVPRSWLHFDAADRAEVIEESWERGWGAPGAGNPLSAPYLESQSSRRDRPLLLLNGASVFDGCALNVSVLQAGATGDQSRPAGANIPAGDCMAVERYLGTGDAPGPLPATVDVLDYLGCPEHRDVRRSTAALLSARFPYVSPAGRLAACGRDGSTKFIVDGGYVDTSAAESAVAIWQALEPLVEEHNRASASTCIVPYFVQLDNSYLATTSPPRVDNAPNQLLAPAIALWQTTGLASRAERARAHAAQLFGPDRYVLLAPRNHPGAKAPLGWTLADASRRDLERELYVGNEDGIRTVRRWLESPQQCP